MDPGRTVLVVDDDDVNRTLAVRQLAKLGYSAEAVSGGREAIEFVRRSPPSAVFLDVHMSDMDGFETARAIRTFEEESGSVRIPIIARTASVTPDDRRACKEAGMDDFIGKPVMLEELAEVLVRWVGEPAGEPRAGPQAGAGTGRTPGDPGLDRLRAELDPETLSRLAGLYVERLPEREAAIQDAVANDDPAALREAAHALKSAASAFYATKLIELCRQVEELGRSGTTGGAAGKLDSLRRESERVANAVAELR